MADQPSFISAETYIKMFIHANKSDQEFPKQVAPEQFTPSEQL